MPDPIDEYLKEKEDEDPIDAYLSAPDGEPVATRLPIEPASRLPIGTSIPILGSAAQTAGEYFSAGLMSVYPGGKFSDNLKRLQQTNAQDELQFAEENPVTAGLSSLAGGFMLPAAPVLNAVKGTSTAARVGNWAGNLGARAAEASAVGATDAGMRGGDAGAAAKDAAIFTGGLGVLGKAAQGVGKYIPRFMFGVRPETAAKYKARAPQINAASEEELVHEVEGAYGRLRDDTVAAKTTRDALRADKAAAERIMQAELQNTRPPADTPAEIADALRGLGKQTSEESSKAFEILQGQDREFGVGPLKGQLTRSINASRIGDAIPDTAENKLLGKYRDFLNATKLKSMRPEELKQFIQLLDEDVSDVYAKLKQPGQRLTAGDKALIGYRRFVDGQLKTDEAYAKAMAPLAEKTKLLNEARDIFSDEQRTARLLKNLYAPENARDRATLQTLGKMTGKNFIGELEGFEEAKAALRDPAEMARRKAALPESQAFAQAEEELGDRKLWLEPVKGLNAQSAVRRAVSEGRPDYKNKERLQFLGDLEGKDFLQTADDLGVQRALSQGFTRGSRNTNLGAFSVGGVLGKIFKGDPAASQVGHGVGAMLGAAADLVGPQTYKAMLDFTMSPKFPQYRARLQEALKRSPNAFIAESNRLARQDPEFQAYMLGSEEQPRAAP